MEKKILDDIVILGRAAPDEISDGRQTVCVGGWSPKEQSYIRIYPTNVISSLSRKSEVSIPVEKNKKDTREESWKIQGSNAEWDNLHEKITNKGKINRKDWIRLIQNLPKTSCIEELNEQKRSLGLIKPNEIINADFEKREKVSKTRPTQLTEFFVDEDRNVINVMTKDNYPIVPKIKWECSGPCKTKQGYHESQVLEWGFYEWIRKNIEEPSKWNQVWENARIFDDDYVKYFFVGNLNKHRSSFMIISIIRWKLDKDKQNQSSLDAFM